MKKRFVIAVVVPVMLGLPLREINALRWRKANADFCRDIEWRLALRQPSKRGLILAVWRVKPIPRGIHVSKVWRQQLSLIETNTLLKEVKLQSGKAPSRIRFNERSLGEYQLHLWWQSSTSSNQSLVTSLMWPYNEQKDKSWEGLYVTPESARALKTRIKARYDRELRAAGIVPSVD